MSRVLFERPGLQLGRYIGPADEGPDRRRWQLTVEGAYIVMAAPALKLFALSVMAAAMEAAADEFERG